MRSGVRSPPAVCSFLPFCSPIKISTFCRLSCARLSSDALSSSVAACSLERPSMYIVKDITGRIHGGKADVSCTLSLFAHLASMLVARQSARRRARSEANRGSNLSYRCVALNAGCDDDPNPSAINLDFNVERRAFVVLPVRGTTFVYTLRPLNHFTLVRSKTFLWCFLSLAAARSRFTRASFPSI
jgi:hypothetical protein